MRLPKAFLSHSSTDKDFVREVAQQLGREFCVFDEFCFHTGDDLEKRIAQGVSASGLLVLFASRKALASDWVKFEIGEARKRKLTEGTYKAITIGVGDDVELGDLPAWLRHALFKPVSNPEQATRIIRAHIDEILRERGAETFVGRHTETARVEDALASGARPRVLVFYGLPAMGRRTLCGRIGRDLLSFQRIVEVDVSTGDKAADLAIALASHVEPYRSRDEFKDRIKRLRRLAPEAAAAVAFSSIVSLQKNGALTALVDSGGLLNPDGSVSEAVQPVLAALVRDENTYAALVSTRRPDVQPFAKVVTTYVEPLSRDESRRLLALLCAKLECACEGEPLQMLAEQCKGHPASIGYAARLVMLYGADAMARELHKVVNFRTEFFLGYLRDRALSPDAVRLLKLLAYYRALPYSVLGSVMQLGSQRLSELTVELVDLSLLRVVDGLYALSEPVEDAVLRVFGFSDVDHRAVASGLSDFLERAAPEERRIELTRALFRAVRFSGQGDSGWALRTTSELLRLGQDLYHEREWDRAIAVLREVLSEDAALDTARQYLVRALIQTDRFDMAAEEAEPLRKKGLLRDYYFLLGFSLRRQGKTAEAIQAYREAEKRGRRDVVVYRELGQCFLVLDRIDEAWECVERALKLNPADRYVIDLKIVLALRRGDVNVARGQLVPLQAVDREEFYWLRRSMVEWYEGNARLALSSARKAVNSAKRPTFSMLSQLAKCLIEAGSYEDAAKAIRRLENAYPRRLKDVKLGLWCKWEIAQGQHRNAEGYWSQLDDKTQAVHRALRLDILRGIQAAGAADSHELARIGEEIAVLQAEVGAEANRYLVVDQRD